MGGCAGQSEIGGTLSPILKGDDLNSYPLRMVKIPGGELSYGSR